MGPDEQAMSWYYYLDNKLRFPFQAKCIASKVVSPLRKGETVEVRRMAPEDACTGEMLVLIRWQSRILAVPLSQLAAIDVDESTSEAYRRLALLAGSRLPFLKDGRRLKTYATLPETHK
jgi:hypothetical protein